MMKGRGLDCIAILVSLALHALLLMIPWQPAEVIELLPLEGTGVVEVAVLERVKGTPAVEEIAEQQPSAQQIQVKPPEAQKEPVLAEKPKDSGDSGKKPLVTIKPIEPAPEVKVRETVIATQESTVTVPQAEGDAAPIEEPAEAGAVPGEQAVEPAAEIKPALPTYPGDDPTGEAMVASKREVAYPKDAMNASSEGDVTVEVTVSQSGSITSTKVVSGPADEALRKNAELTILRYWTFKGSDRAYKVVIEVSFRMQPEARTSQRFLGASFLD